MKTTRQSARTLNKVPKFVYGAVAGAVVGLIAVWNLGTGAVILAVGLALVAAYVFAMTDKKTSKLLVKITQGRSQAHVLSLLVIGITSIAGAYYFNQTFAWHPEGKITKTAQNLTTGGVAVEANTAAAAVPAKMGDIIQYTIAVSNIAPDASNNYNDLGYTTMVDSLPAGVEMVGDPGHRDIVENMGTILPGKTVIKTYQVIVTSTVNGVVILNQACYTANSVVKDNPKSGCDDANIKVTTSNTPTPTPSPTPTPNPTPTPPGGEGETTPTPSPTPTPTPVPTPTPAPQTPIDTVLTTIPDQLPNTGPGAVFIIAAFAVITGYIVHRIYWYSGSKR